MKIQSGETPKIWDQANQPEEKQTNRGRKRKEVSVAETKESDAVKRARRKLDKQAKREAKMFTQENINTETKSIHEHWKRNPEGRIQVSAERAPPSPAITGLMNQLSSQISNEKKQVLDSLKGRITS